MCVANYFPVTYVT